jgi:myo-inositol 2-dehydrogenase / D-chiro-inositol 1-dehydrogenase
VSEPLRVGVVGLGAVAQAVHLPLLLRHRNRFKIAALCELSPSTLTAIGERCRVPATSRFATLDDLLAAGGVEALMILSSGSHGAAASAALRAGLAVFAEKPLAYTLDEIDDIRAAAGDEGRLQLGYMKLYDPAFVRARQLASEAPPPRSVEVTVLHPSGESQLAHVGLLPTATDLAAPAIAQIGDRLRSLQQAALGSAAIEIGPLYTDVLLGSIVHDLAMVRALAGDPTAIEFAQAWPADGFPNSIEILGTLPSGAHLSIRWHYLARYPAYRETLAVHHEEGSIALTFPSPYLLHAPTKLSASEPDGRFERVTTLRSSVEAFEEQLLAFWRLARQGERPAAGIDAGRADIVTCQRIAARLAALRGLTVGGEAASA